MKSNGTKWLISATLVICMWGVALAQSTASDSVEKSQPTVTVPFFVEDSHGNPLTEILPSDLAVLDDKRTPSSVVAVHTAQQLPLRLGLLIDNSGSQKYTKLYAPGAKAAFDFVNNIFNGPEDKVFVMGFANDSGGTGFLNKDDFLKLKFTLEPGGHTALYDAVKLACSERMANDSMQHARRVLVVMTDGDDNKSHVSLAKAILAAQDSRTMIFVIGTGSRYARSPFETTDVDPVLEQLALETGGLSFSGLEPKDLPKVFGTIKTRVDHMYSVIYIPGESGSAKHFHSVELKITSDKQWKVHAPRGYAVQ